MLIWVKFFLGHPKNFGNFELGWTHLSARIRGGSPPGGGVEYKFNCHGILYHFPALDFEKQKIRKKYSRRMSPPWTPLDRPFFSNCFSALDHRAPLLYFFLLLYYRQNTNNGN